MGGGSVIRQHKRRLLQGEPEETGRKEECEEAYWMIKSFGKCKVRETESGEYELVKGTTTVGIFSEACIEERRILFPLSHGMLLEVSNEGISEIATPDKAVLFGLISSDGSNAYYWRIDSKGRYHSEYSTRFYSEDNELIELFDELFEKIYGLNPHHYIRKRNGLITAAIYSKGVYYDLSDYDVKTGAYEFRVPREHLDYEGKRAYLKGFFSGDGKASLTREGSLTIRFYSKCKEGLEGLRQLLIDLGFHPHEIREEREEPEGVVCWFSIPSREHMKFIEDIGSFKPRHREVFEEYGRLRGEEGERS
ncbi:MAG: LAGLIDADG family homing endonuclease [Candidatus Brockarchaeota archaeon]|nr:LAGLIDADG family homing endonuclease [Candidatus Brockarchaeota archaeon]